MDGERDGCRCLSATRRAFNPLHKAFKTRRLPAVPNGTYTRFHFSEPTLKEDLLK